MEELDNNNRGSNNNSGGNRQYLVGDRVWFYSEDRNWDGSNPNTYRGIVKEVRDDDLLDIMPLQSMINRSDFSITLEKWKVFPDFCDMTLRFDVGDRVL